MRQAGIFMASRIGIARGLPRPVFRYFGSTDLGSRSRSWFDEYDGIVRQFHPEKIELRLGREAAVIEFPVRVDALAAAYSGVE